ncbi:MAG: hypothetical protein Kilf2KO_13800 [Rhodospirillales bacterium]
MPESPLLIDRGAALRLARTRRQALLQVAFWPDDLAVAGPALAAALGFDFPPNGWTVAGLPQGFAYRTAPDRLLIAGADLLAATHDALGDAGVVTDLSHARQRLELAGGEAAALLSRGLDRSAGGLVPGTFAQTRLRDAGLLLHCLETDRFHLLVPSSFAEAVVDWLVQADEIMHY